MDPRLLTPFLIAALVVWSIYRRTRRSFGRQTVVPGRMWLRVGVFTVLTALVLLASARDLRLLAALAAGLACGAALGYIGLRYTRFEVTPEGRFYTPHAYLGLIVTALFLGRIVYRFVIMYAAAHGAGPADAGLAGAPSYPAYAYASPYANPYASSYANPYAFHRSPLTLAIFGTLVGYYVLYYLGILSKIKSPPAASRAVP